MVAGVARHHIFWFYRVGIARINQTISINSSKKFSRVGNVHLTNSNSHYKNRFFESPPRAGFQKTDFGVSSAVGAGNTKIGFIMRTATLLIFKPLCT
jgi:hypothetical protein